MWFIVIKKRNFIDLSSKISQRAKVQLFLLIPHFASTLKVKSEHPLLNEIVKKIFIKCIFE